jgi:hypothetical protein
MNCPGWGMKRSGSRRGKVGTDRGQRTGRAVQRGRGGTRRAGRKREDGQRKGGGT